MGPTPHIEMPDGMYLSITGQIHPGRSGQTRALLLRNRLLAEQTQVEPVLLSLDDAPHYPRIREMLREQGELIGAMRLLNIFEWYRDHDIDGLPPTGDRLPPVEGLDAIDVPHPDGTIYQTRYVTRFGADPKMIDYRRPDGSVYLRVPAGKPAMVSRMTKVFLVNSEGEPVGSWASQRGWRRNWVLQLLEPGRRTFLISDSRFAIADILPLSDPRLHLIHVVHNMHLHSPYHPNSPLIPAYLPVLSSLPSLDALVTLTDRQRQDVAERFGATDNLYVIGHPVDLPSEPDPRPSRQPMRFIVLARLEFQKGLDDALEAFALVVKEEPAARLDIYGQGSLHTQLTLQIEALGLQNAVRLRGYDSQATETLWSATGLIVTSRFEGFSLAILEARGRGCPVVSYDMKYGPREQITSGKDGFLVPARDVRALADGVLRLIRDPDLVRRMSATARESVGRHSHQALIEDWHGVLERVVAKRQHRVELTSVELEVFRLGYIRPQRLPEAFGRTRFLRRFTGRRSASAGFRRAPRMEFTGRLQVQGSGRHTTLDDVRLTLDAVAPVSGAVIPLPLTVSRTGQHFRLGAVFDPAPAFAAAGPGTRTLTLRLRLVWHNSSWDAVLTRPSRLAANYEFSYAADGVLSLLHRPRASTAAAPTGTADKIQLLPSSSPSS